MKMPFGKYKGMLLDDIFEEHPEYIIWLHDNCKNLHGSLKEYVKFNYPFACVEVEQREALSEAVESGWEADCEFGGDDWGGNF